MKARDIYAKCKPYLRQLVEVLGAIVILIAIWPHFLDFLLILHTFLHFLFCFYFTFSVAGTLECPSLCPSPAIAILDCPSVVYGGEQFNVKVNWSDSYTDCNLKIYLQDNQTQLTDVGICKISSSFGNNTITLRVKTTRENHNQAKLTACLYDEKGKRLSVYKKEGIKVLPTRVKINNCSPLPVHGGEDLWLNISWYNMTDDWELVVSLKESQSDQTPLAYGGPSKINSERGEGTFILQVFRLNEDHNESIVRAEARFFEDGVQKNIIDTREINVHKSKINVNIINCSPSSVCGEENLQIKVSWNNVPINGELKISLEKSDFDHTQLAHLIKSELDSSSGEETFTLKVFQVTETYEEAQVFAGIYEGTDCKAFDKEVIRVQPNPNT